MGGILILHDLSVWRLVVTHWAALHYVLPVFSYSWTEIHTMCIVCNFERYGD